MDKRIKETLGQYLSNEREARHISLEDISKAICIRLPFIRALEEDDLDVFAQEEVVPGYLRLYTHHLGLDYDDVLRRYHIQKERHRSGRVFQQLSLFVDYDSPPVLPATSDKIPLYRRIVHTALVALTIAAVLILLLMYIYPLGQALTPTTLMHRMPTTGNVTRDPIPQEGDGIVPFQKEQPTDVIAREEANKIALRNEHPEAPPSSAQRRNAKVIGNSDSKRYHLSGMKYYKMIKAYHRVEFDSEEEAIMAGYHRARE